MNLEKANKTRSEKAINKLYRFEDRTESYKNRIDRGQIVDVNENEGKFEATEIDGGYRICPKAVYLYFKSLI